MATDTQTWLAAYLYYAEPWEDFLTKAVKPFVEAVFARKQAEQFFFIRYWERGPHIRLRFKGDPQQLQQAVQPELAAYFSHYFEEHPSTRVEPESMEALPESHRWFPNNSIQYIAYEPEVERYGGPAGIGIAERQFEASSRAILSILAESEDWNYDRALGAAIQLHLGFSYALGMSLQEAIYFYTFYSEVWLPAGERWMTLAYRSDGFLEDTERPQKTMRQAFEETFVEQRAALIPYHKILWEAFHQGVSFEQDWLNDWIVQMKRVAAALKQAQQQGHLSIPAEFTINPQLAVPEASQRLWSILGSYVHMINNRLGVLNRDEGYLGYLIKESLTALAPIIEPVQEPPS